MLSFRHHVSTAAFPASQPFDEPTDWSIWPYSEARKFSFKNYAFVTAGKALH
jgi:hypothetical protein